MSLLPLRGSGDFPVHTVSITTLGFYNDGPEWLWTQGPQGCRATTSCPETGMSQLSTCSTQLCEPQTGPLHQLNFISWSQRRFKSQPGSPGEFCFRKRNTARRWYRVQGSWGFHSSPPHSPYHAPVSCLSRRNCQSTHACVHSS